MKLPSIARLPKSKSFEFRPRYYDPVKEEIENRTQRIKEEMRNEKSGHHRANITKGFDRRERERGKATMMQYLLVILFFGAFFGYMYFGNDALYIAGGVFVFYVYWRVRRGR